jgi:ABC-type branched-subunit amino acid transport system ATPase component
MRLVSTFSCSRISRQASAIDNATPLGSEDAVVLDRGRAVFRGKSAELQADEALQHRLLAVGER